MIMMDIPQVAYKTWGFEYYTGDKRRDRELEMDLAEELKREFPEYQYSKNHDHVR